MLCNLVLVMNPFEESKEGGGFILQKKPYLWKHMYLVDLQVLVNFRVMHP